MKKSDFVEVHFYTVSAVKNVYGGGIIYAKEELSDSRAKLVGLVYEYHGTTLLTEEFYNKFDGYGSGVDGILDFTYIE